MIVSTIYLPPSITEGYLQLGWSKEQETYRSRLCVFEHFNFRLPRMKAEKIKERHDSRDERK